MVPDFYSSLKDRNTLEPSGFDIASEEITLIGRTPSKTNPLTKEEALVIGQARYTEIKSMFEDNSWSIKDYLAYYNNMDTGPFIAALKNLVKYYSDRNVDVFKDAISGIPVLGR